MTSRRNEIRAAIERAAPELIERILADARNGDTHAAIALLDRVAPKLRPANTVVVSLDGSAEQIGQRLLDQSREVRP